MDKKCSEQKRLDDLEEEVAEQKATLLQLVKDVMRIWHIAIGVGLGLALEKFGIDKLLSKLL
ncbi:tail fiber assembly protein [Vibrio phage VPMS1]|uniref:tail fiber assembly protein n=1 Tax=Vibrio phage VPMS1 TaxID=1233488 RepID=UPI0003585E24|nr:tail fiber assembly protein [Vibrio phage VPMS1]AFV51102.1 tail fiber assembly protein [Vibrio phage VPMS1]